jgi:hypothetical protein
VKGKDLAYWNNIDKYGTYISIGVDVEPRTGISKQLDNILSLVHILIAVGIYEDQTVLQLLIDTLVGLGLTITDDKNLVESIVKEIQEGHETGREGIG